MAYKPLEASVDDEPHKRNSKHESHSFTKVQLAQACMVRDREDLIWILNRISQERSDIDVEVTLTAVKEGTTTEPPHTEPDFRKDRIDRRASGGVADETHGFPVVQFARVEFHVFPQSDCVELQLSRTGNKEARSEIKFETKDMTAKAGLHYTKTQDTAVFDPGVGTFIAKVPLLQVDTWEAMVDFEVHLIADTAENVKVGRQLNSTKVKVIGTESFPAPDLRQALEEDEELDDHGNKIRFFISFLKLLWADRVIRRGIIKRCFQGQLRNVNFVIMQFISVFTVNYIFGDKGGDEKIWLLTRDKWLMAIVGVQISSMMLLHGMDFMKLGWSVGGPARKMIQKGILRRFMYLDIESRNEVRSTDLATAVTRNSLAIVGGVGQCIALSNVLGGIIAILVFKLTSPIVFHSGKSISLLSFSPFIVYPVVLGTCIWRRAPNTTTALDRVQDAKDDLLEYCYQAVETFPVLNDYRRRNKYVDDLDHWINEYNKANKEKNKIVTNNTYLPHWLSTLFVGFWYLFFGKEVISGFLTLGFFIADLKVIEKFGNEFEQLYSILMAMESNFPDLQRVVILLNRDTDLDDRLKNEKVTLEKTESKRRELSKDGEGALDRVPIEVSNLRFSVGQKFFNFKGMIHVEQGSMVCLIGKHGHGKSMLLKVIAGGLFPNLEDGEVFIPSHLRVIHVPFEAVFLRKNLYDNMVLGCEVESDSSHQRIQEILERLKLGDYYFDHIKAPSDEAAASTEKTATKKKEDTLCKWMQSLTVKEASMLNLARALIANPHILCVHKPTLAKSKSDADTVMKILQEFKDKRGCVQDSTQPVSHRRPRTVLYTSIARSSASYASQIYRVETQSVSEMKFSEVTDEVFG